MNQEKWGKFFSAAGIPPKDGKHYASLFMENRIREDMLGELNKELLNEMGIKPLGDVLAIIKAAKKGFSMEDETPSSNQEPVKVKTVPKAPVTVTAANPTSSVKKEPITVYKREVRLPSKPTKQTVLMTVSPPVAFPHSNAEDSVLEVKAEPKRQPIKPPTSSSNSSEDECQIVRAVRDARKSLKMAPDASEYVVSMPKGSTPKSRELLRKAGVLKGETTTTRVAVTTSSNRNPVTSGGVFARLGLAVSAADSVPTKRIRLRKEPSPEVTSTTDEGLGRRGGSNSALARLGLPIKAAASAPALVPSTRGSVQSTEQHDPESFAASLPPCPDTGVGVAENQTYRVNGHHYREHEREDDAVATASSDLGLTLYGVFDGEGGRRAVDYAREKFPAEILLAEPKQLGSREGVEDLLLATFEAVERGYMASIDPFLAERAPILADIAGLDEGEASRHFPKEMERLGLINRELSSGVTAVVALVKEQALYVANVGDCRALLVKTDPEGCLRVLQLSVQHDTSNQDECLRLRHLGLDEATLRHIRAPTRCLGDYPRKGGWHDHDQYKAAREEPVLATPDIHPPIPLDASAQFLILCSPGLYLTLEEVYGVSKVNAKLAQMVASQFEVAGSVAGVAQAVVDLVCRHHLDTFTRHEERSFLCRSRQMVASQFEVAGSVAGVAQAVVDLVCRHHLDTFTRHEERSFLCRSRQDITLLIRNFNYPLSGGVPWDEATLDSNSAVSTLPRTQRSVLPLDANGRIAPYVSFAGFYQAVQDYGKQAENPPKAPDDEQQSP